MSDAENAALIERFWQALADKDFAGAAASLHDEFIEEWPQSGERIRGPDNWLAMASGHPTFPSIRPERTEGVDDLWVTHAHFEYPMPDGPAPFEVGSIQRVRDGKIAHIVEYFAPPFEAAEWRSAWVERTR